MSAGIKLIVVCLCLTIVSCKHKGTQTATVAVPSPPTAASPAPETRLPEGLGRSEPGDTSPGDFVGTLESQEKQKSGQQPGVLNDVRFGQHENYDRVVFEFTSPEIPGYRVHYVEQPPVTCGAGDTVVVEGSADLVVQITPAQAHNDQGSPTVTARDSKPAMRIVRQARLTCDFEAEVQWVLGLTERRAFRVMELKNPARLVIDVKHSGREIS